MQRFIEQPLMVLTHSKERGWGFILGKALWGDPVLPQDETNYSIRLLSLYEYSVIKYNHIEGKSTTTNLWLLKLLLGNHTPKEIKLRAVTSSVAGHEYTVTKYLRVEGYTALRYLLPWLSKKTEVYLVSSNTDKELCNFTFFSPEWAEEQRTPNTNEIINQSKKIYKLVGASNSVSQLPLP